MLKTFFVCFDDFIKKIQQITDNLLDLINKTNYAFSSEKTLLEKNSYQFISEILVPNDRVEKTLYAILFNLINKTELLSAESGNVALLTFLNFIKEFTKNTSLLETNEMNSKLKFDNSFEKIKELIKTNIKKTNYNVVCNKIKIICQNDTVLTEVLLNLINLMGLEGKCRTEDGLNQNYIIELKSGYSFKLEPYKNLLKNNIWKENNVKVLLIDGMLEKVSEISNLLDKSIQTKTPLAIVARGYSEEVIATVALNNTRNVFNIFPVKIFSDLDSINIFSDLAVVTGRAPVSSLQGEMVQFIDYDSIPTVELINCTEKEFIIENSKTISNINDHLRNLLKKRNENQLTQDVVTLIDNRIKNLFSHNVIINLPNLSNIKKTEIKTKIDITLRTLKTLLNYGFIELDEFKIELSKMNCVTIHEELFKKVLLQTFEKANNTKIPTLSLYLGVLYAYKSALLLMNSKGFVQIHDQG